MSGFFSEDQDIWSRREGVCKRNNRAHGQKVGGCLSLLGLPQQTGWLNQEKSICQSSGGWESKVKYQHNQTLVSFLFLPCRWLPSCCVLTGWKERKSSLLLIRTLPPSWGHHPHDIIKTQYLSLTAPSPNIITSRVRASIHDSWRDTFWSTTLCLPLKFMSFLGCKVHSFNPNSSQSPRSSTLKSKV